MVKTNEAGKTGLGPTTSRSHQLRRTQEATKDSVNVLSVSFPLCSLTFFQMLVELVRTSEKSDCGEYLGRKKVFDKTIFADRDCVLRNSGRSFNFGFRLWDHRESLVTRNEKKKE